MSSSKNQQVGLRRSSRAKRATQKCSFDDSYFEVKNKITKLQNEETPTEKLSKKNKGNKFQNNAKAARQLLVSPTKSVQLDLSSDLSDSDDENIGAKIKHRQSLLRNEKLRLINELNIASGIKNLMPIKAKTKTIKVTSRIKKQPVIQEATRSSMRLKGRDSVSLNEKNLENLNLEVPQPLYVEPKITSKAFKMLDVDFQENLLTDEDKKWNESHDKFLREIAASNFERPAPKLTESEKDYVKILKSLKINDNRVKKIVPQRIFSMTIHPREDKTIIAAGDKSGYMGIWDVNNTSDINEGIYHFKPHQRPISCLKFSDQDVNKLFMSSYDGTIRYADLGKTEISETVFDDIDYSIACFEFLSPNDDSCLAAGSYDGDVLIIDRREKMENRYKAYPSNQRRVKTISVHPTKHHYICTAHQKGVINIYDLRKLPSSGTEFDPFLSITAHTNTVNSARFDPFTGNKLLTLGLDDKIKIFNSENISPGTVAMNSSMYHDNQTRRWLSSFRTTWHPFCPNIFAVGSMNRPTRQIDIFNSNLDRVFTLKNDYLTTITSIVCFHPTQNIIAGGNSSGKVFVFQ